MNTQSFYRPSSVSGSDEVFLSRPLVVNCAGVYANSAPFATHSKHGRKDYYLLYLHTGRMEVSMDGSLLAAAAGDLVVYYPHTAYSYIKAHDEPFAYY